MTQDVQDAIEIISAKMTEMHRYSNFWTQDYSTGLKVLYHAIRHLAYPDRDVYPKTRRGTKGAPIVRR